MPDTSLPHLHRSNAEQCPRCGADLQGEPIPEDIRHHYGATHFSRKIGLSDPRLDRVTHWRCPDCNHEWPR